MNNDTNNNLNGTVLGSVNTNTLNNNPVTNETIETLDAGVPNQSSVMGGNVIPPISNQPEQNIFFNNGDMSSNNQDVVPNSVPPISNNVEQPVSMPQPMPAYTNPQTINPMPGFENSGAIGTTPPISLEPDKKPKKKGNKILFIIIIFVALAGVGFGTYYVLNYTDLLKQQATINVSTKDLEVNIGDVLSTNIMDYANVTGTDVRNCSLNTNNVDVTKIGTYEYQVTCGDNVKVGKIVVVDNNELVVETKNLYKVKGSTLEAKEFAISANDNLTYEFVDQNDVNTKLNGDFGSYTVRIKVTSQSGKSTEVDGKLVLMEYAIKGHTICTSKEQNVNGVSAVMSVSEKFAIVNDGKNGYGKIAYEIHAFKFSDETEYTSLLASYKTNNKITINNITGAASFDDTNLTITIANERDNESIISEYGENNLVNYSSIKNYFEKTLGYTCTYEKLQ